MALKPEYLKLVATEIRSQLLATAAPNVIGSWGITTPFMFGELLGMPALIFAVNARLHQGLVYICLNGSDLYDIYLKPGADHPRLFADDIYCDQLADALDTAIESGTDPAAYDAFCEQECIKLFRANLN